ncbi:PINc/VapC family ATPase [Candidatus Methanosphaera massiliense]|uniref:PINc/VapC family ATPase n=1 Tax=Methanosphaera TaxID=2316 RepID=UPI000DC34797|nr:PINc/VapC family ATPase [Candidatus Methanosphaera massiliense]MDD6286440.1 PINc/VapC family ATPase [Methanobacteriaceae archaeon]MDE4078924.1 PINc/VapC family ATPase [Candidatus Methanosphaera massiliense]MDY2744930.1 PINc/VapC family ATPase [Methanosphaera sp.]RAP45021.1 MAG: ATPase [Methanosphaera sp. SHI1033]
MTKLVPDTSIVIDQQVSRIVQEEYEGAEVLIPEAVPSEIENHANKGKEIGYQGLDELKKLRQLSEEGIITLSYVGRRPKLDEISIASGGEIDAMIRDIARKYHAILLTSDKLQKEVAEAQGVETYFYKKEPEHVPTKITELEKYFSDDISSVHLKENTTPIAKKGTPGHVELVELDYVPLRYRDMNRISKEIIEQSKIRHDSFIEIDKKGATVVQFGDLRITIARPPFSDGLEITAIKPVNQLDLEDYNITDKLLERLSNDAKGILVAGSPGAGKSTFAQALAEYYYYDMEQIVKTMESPRDMNLDDNITQYAPLEGDMENTADILLLVRPDFTIFDEVRKTRDFEIYSDMRLAGVGMIGVVHATRAIDAVQRFIGRLELGVIPSVIDTVVYIEDGQVETVYSIELTVKVPTGMIEADLSRPVIEIKDFETEELFYEIYTYGEQTIVMDINKAYNDKDVEEEEKSPVSKIVERAIRKEVNRVSPNAIMEVSLISDKRALLEVDPDHTGAVIGKNGRTIAQIEERAGISIDVEELELKDIDSKIPINVNVSGNYLSLNFKKEDIGDSFDIIVEDEYLFTATVGKKANIRLKKDIEMAEIIINAMKKDEPIYARLRNEDLY